MYTSIAYWNALHVHLTDYSHPAIHLLTAELLGSSDRTKITTRKRWDAPENSPITPLTMAVLQPFRDDYYLWHYLPSVPAAIIFLLTFLGCTLGLSWKSWKAHLKFGIPFIIGTFCQSTKDISANLPPSGLLTFYTSRSHWLRCSCIRPQ